MSRWPAPRDLARLYALTGRLANPFLSAAEDTKLAQHLTALPAHDWPRLAQLADRSHLLPALWPRLQALDLTAAPPRDIAEACHAAHLLNTDRNAQLKAEAARIGHILAPAGLRPVVLKGVAQIVNGAYAHIGTRLTADIDLLLAPDQVGAAAQLLQEHGYRAKPSEALLLDTSPRAFAMNHHLAGLRHKDSPAATELHHRFFPQGHEVLTAKDILSAAQPARDMPDLMVPSAYHRALMALGHTPLRFRVFWGDQLRLWDAIDMHGASLEAGLSAHDLLPLFTRAGWGAQAGWMLRFAEEFAGLALSPDERATLPGAAHYRLERAFFMRPALRHRITAFPAAPPLAKLFISTGHRLHLRTALTDQAYRAEWRKARRARDRKGPPQD